MLQNVGYTIYHTDLVLHLLLTSGMTRDRLCNVTIIRYQNSRKANPNPTVDQPTCFKCNTIYRCSLHCKHVSNIEVNGIQDRLDDDNIQ